MNIIGVALLVAVSCSFTDALSWPVADFSDCLLPKDPGPCRGYFPRYFFNSTSKKCEIFIYGGCLGNNNRFHSYPQCAVKCLHACTQLPRDPGPCKGYFPRYFYNTSSRQCERFIYGGCGGNRNRFNTYRRCATTCFVSSPPKCEIKGATYTHCASQCPPTCSEPVIACIALCRPGCACPSGQVIDEKNKRCIPKASCPIDCKVKGQRFFDGISECVPCTGTCDNPNPVCLTICRSGCGCPLDTVLNENGTECIHPRTCPRDCEYNKRTYKPGDEWDCSESGECRKCLCLYNGVVANHTIGCPKSCNLSNGAEIPHGESVTINPCRKCTCDDGNLNCTVADCSHITCTNPVIRPGECCGICADCKIKGQKFYDARYGECVPCTGTCEVPNPVCTKDCRSGCGCPDGDVVNDEGTECIHPRTCPRMCEYKNRTYNPGDKWDCSEPGKCRKCWCLTHGAVAKHSIGCPGAVCTLRNGTVIHHGDSYKRDPCTTCHCDNGTTFCASVGCAPLPPGCRGYYIPKGQCCPVCRPQPPCSVVSCIFPRCYPPFGYIPPLGPGECCPSCACRYGGKVYKVGQGFPSTDGCNVCGCLAGGRVVCTQRHCGP